VSSSCQTRIRPMSAGLIQTPTWTMEDTGSTVEGEAWEVVEVRRSGADSAQQARTAKPVEASAADDDDPAGAAAGAVSEGEAAAADDLLASFTADEILATDSAVAAAPPTSTLPTPPMAPVAPSAVPGLEVRAATPLLVVVAARALAASRMAFLALWTALAILATVLASPTFGHVLTLMPVADDAWAIKALAAALRLGTLVLALAHATPARPAACVAALARLVSAAAVELALLFAQPVFSTLAGGVFKPGDAAKATLTRLGRSAWSSSAAMSPASLLAAAAVPAVVVIALLYALASLDRRPRAKPALTHFSTAFERAHACASSVVAPLATTTFSALKAVLVAAAFARLHLNVLDAATSADVSSTLAAVPPELLMSRHEFALYRWSFDSTAAIVLAVIGDLITTNAAAPPAWGAAGALALGGGLLLADVQPTTGYVLLLVAWLVSAASARLYHALAPAAAREPAASSRLAAVARTPHGRLLLLAVEAVLLASPSYTLAAGGLLWRGAAAVVDVLRGLVL